MAKLNQYVTISITNLLLNLHVFLCTVVIMSYLLHLIKVVCILVSGLIILYVAHSNLLYLHVLMILLEPPNVMVTVVFYYTAMVSDLNRREKKSVSLNTIIKLVSSITIIMVKARLSVMINGVNKILKLHALSYIKIQQ